MDRAPSSQTRWTLGLMVVLAAVTLAVFWPASGYDYVRLDDDQYVAGNPHVLTGLTPENVRWAFTTVYEHWWLPVLWLSFMADSSLFGPEPFGFHLTNILLHAANAALLFWVLFRLTGSRGRSFFVAALFALHPLRVESVAWITARKDVLSGLFFLLALLAYVRHVERPSRARMTAVAGLMLLGLMSKGILVILPFILLLLDAWPLRRAAIPRGRGTWTAWRPLLAEKLLLFLLSAVFILLNLHTHVTGSGSVAGLSLWTRLGLMPPNVWAYLGKIFWPVNLVILHPERDVVFWPVSIAAAIGLAGITILAFRLRRMAPYLLIGWLWFLIALLPVLRGVRLGLAAYADRYVYLPSIGLALALVWPIGHWAGRHRPRGPLLAGLAGLLVLAACTLATRAYLPFWSGSTAMFTRLIEFSPDCSLAQNSYGKVLLEQGRPAEALPHFVRAGELGSLVAPRNRADALIRLGREREAIDHLLMVLSSSNQESPDLHTLLGVAYLNEDRAAEAIPHLEKAIAGSMQPLGLQIALVRARFETGNTPAAREAIRGLHALGYPPIRDFDSLIVYYVKLGETRDVRTAWLFFRNNLRRHPNHVVLLNNAAWLLATTKTPPAPPAEALRLARHAADLAPVPHPGILDTLAAAQAANGQFDDAIATAQQALDLARQAGDSATAADIEQRLDAYRHGRPWRD